MSTTTRFAVIFCLIVCIIGTTDVHAQDNISTRRALALQALALTSDQQAVDREQFIARTANVFPSNHRKWMEAKLRALLANTDLRSIAADALATQLTGDELTRYVGALRDKSLIASTLRMRIDAANASAMSRSYIVMIEASQQVFIEYQKTFEPNVKLD